jgi:hypothetical protein
VRSLTIGVVVAVLLAPTMGCAKRGRHSEWVKPGRDGKLAYKTTERGDRIMDFSHAGYMGGGVAIPDVPVKKTVRPLGEGKDDTAAIQAAIDEVAKLPADEKGLRGAVLLAPGVFTCGKTITLATGGVVLRGSGSSEGGTTIKMVGDRHRAITIGAERAPQTDTGNQARDAAPASGAKTSIADGYVPAGTNSFTVADAAGLAVGDRIAIIRPTTKAWLHLLGMDTLKRDGKPQTFIGANRSGVTERIITAISANRITVDISLSDSYDAAVLNPPGTTVTKVRPPGNRVTQVGVENLHIQCPAIESSYGQHPYSAIRVAGDDCWVRDVFCEETMNTTTFAGRRITMQRVRVKKTHPNLGASKPADFSFEGTENLIDRCESSAGNTYWVWTGSLVPGPNVVLNSVFRGHGSRIQPHQRWATGMLVDNCAAPDGGIDYPNRGVAGSGHGWTMGWGVVWNSVADFFVIQQPPGAVNWAIGNVGERVKTARYFDTAPILPEGEFESHGKPVAPASLYLAQLQARLGPAALKNLGYDANVPEAFADTRKTPRLRPLKTEDHPQLGADFALHRPLAASSMRGNDRTFAGEKAVDADESTYWMTADDDNRRTLEIDMEGPVEINALELREASGHENRVQAYKVEAQVDSDWTLLSEGTAVGGSKIDRFPKVTAWKVRLTITKSDGAPALRKFGLYLDGKAAAN